MASPADHGGEEEPRGIRPGAVLSELAVIENVLDIRTGELVPAADVDRVADILRHLRDYRSQLMDAVKACEQALIEEARRRGTKTLHLDGADATISGGQAVEWDVTVLDELVAAGLPQERFAELVTIEQTYRVNANVAKQLSGANPKYAEIVARAKRYVERPYRVAVK